MEIPNCFYRISVKALILDETRTKFLVVKEDNGKWELPGGGLDHGEGVESCLRRELLEEMGLNATMIKNAPAYFLPGHKNQYDRWITNILFETEVEHLNFTPSEECVEVRFVTAEEAKALPSFENVQLLAAIFDPENHR